MASSKCGCVWDLSVLFPCKDHKMVSEERDRYKNALTKIIKEDGPGLDGSPAGPCYKIAQDAISPPAAKEKKSG